MAVPHLPQHRDDQKHPPTPAALLRRSFKEHTARSARVLWRAVSFRRRTHERGLAPPGGEQDQAADGFAQIYLISSRPEPIFVQDVILHNYSVEQESGICHVIQGRRLPL
jgi:hypothetical protein